MPFGLHVQANTLVGQVMVAQFTAGAGTNVTVPGAVNDGCQVCPPSVLNSVKMSKKLLT